jgi:hypothetical protein
VATNGNVVNVDAIQVEPGGSASAFTTTGPRIRGFWGGHADRLPATWQPGTSGFAGLVPAQFVGPLAALAQLPMHTDLAAAILAKGPACYWPLWDGSSATAFDDLAGNGAPSLTRLDGKYGAAPVFSPGAATNLPGDPGGSGVSIDAQAPGPSFANIPTSVAQAGLTSGSRLTNVGAAAPPFAVTVAVWAAHTTLTIAESYFLTLLSSSFDTRFAITTSSVPNQLRALYVNNDGPGGAAQAVVANDVWADGKMHLWVMTLNITTGPLTGTTKLYIDGVLQASDTESAATGPWGAPWNFDIVQLGGVISPDNGFTESGLPGGVFAHLAVFNRELTSQEITDLYNAGRGYVGELSGTRAARYLAQNYNGRTVVDAGRSTMGPPTVTEGGTLLPALQRVVDTEGGNQFEDQNGWIRIEGRDARFLRATPVAVFGENTAGGEIPYADAPTFGYDTTQITNTATVQQTGGTKAIGGPDAASVKSYYPRGLPLDVDCQSPLEAQDHANWLVANRRQPKQRVESITINVGANPALIPAIMDLEVGLRYTVARRPEAANSGAGITMLADYFLEKITHRQVDPELGTWWVDLQLSPVPLQPWILGDSTYGVLDTTTVLGF